jgi:preprotein translocase subunit SecD
MISRVLLPVIALMLWASPATSEENIAFSLVLANGRVDVPLSSNPTVSTVPDESTKTMTINVTLPREAALRFGQLSKVAVGQPLAIVVGCRTLSTSMLQAPILGGAIHVSCRLTTAACDEIAETMRRGTPLCDKPM